MGVVKAPTVQRSYPCKRSPQSVSISPCLQATTDLMVSVTASIGMQARHRMPIDACVDRRRGKRLPFRKCRFCFINSESRPPAPLLAPWGLPSLWGNPLQSGKPPHGQARREDRSHQRRHQRYRCRDRQTLSIRRRDGSRYRLKRALGGSRQGGAARDRGLVSDAGNVAATKVLVDQVTTKHGRIDVLFVNAGIAKFAPIAQSTKPFTTAISTSTSRAHTS